MTGTRKKLPLKRPAAAQRKRVASEDASPTEARLRQPTEARSKYVNNEWRVQGRSKKKGKPRATSLSPPPSKRRRRSTRHEVEEEPEEACEDTSTEQYSASSVHRTSVKAENVIQDISSESDSGGNEPEDDENDTIVLSAEPSPPKKTTRRKVKKEPAPPQQMHAPQWKQIAVVDRRGMPYGNGATFLSEDIKKFAKGLNPTCGWGDQPLEDKQRFFDRIAADWNIRDVRGQPAQINPSWYPQFVTKTLINVRHNLMKMIDRGEDKPADVDPDVWKTLEDKRQCPEAQEKSAKMRSISKGKASKEAQLRAIEKTMIGQLTLVLKRIPYKGEVKEATEKEYARRVAESKKGSVDYLKDIQELQASSSEVGRRLAQLEETIRQLVLSLAEKGIGKNVGIPAADGSVSDLGKRTDSVMQDVRNDDNVFEDIAGDATADAVEVGHAAEDSAADMEADVDYLVDSISDAAEKEADPNVAVDVQVAAAQEDSNAAVVAVVTGAPTNAKMSSQVVSDPYSIGMKEASAHEVLASPAIAVQAAQVAEVVPLPSAVSSSRSNRVTRNMVPAKPNKFVAPTKATKAAAPKVSKPSPPKAADTPKKGASPRKK